MLGFVPILEVVPAALRELRSATFLRHTRSKGETRQVHMSMSGIGV